MNSEKIDWQGPRQPVRNPADYPGYPSAKVREGIRQWGSAEDWQRWRKWEEFIRGETDEEPDSLAEWLPNYELVRLEREREAEEAGRRRQEKLTRRAVFVMREQISALEHAIASGYVRSPLVFAFKGYPGPVERKPPAGDGWKKLAWNKRYGSYARKWSRFMTGETDQPPGRPANSKYPAGWEVEMENKGYVGSDPPEGWDRWPDEPDRDPITGERATRRDPGGRG